MRFIKQVRSYIGGSPKVLEGASNPHSAVLEVELHDNRTVQLVVDDTGHIRIRAWGNTPALVGNGDQIWFGARLEFEEPTHDEHCHPLPKKEKT